MKKLGGFLVLLIIATSFFVVTESKSAWAAACSNVSSFGAVSLNVPNLGNRNEQALWIRMQGEGTARILAEINGQECLEIFANDLSPDIWVWQNYRANGVMQSVSFPKSAGNTIKLIGLTDGTRIDRVLLTDMKCIPEDYGNNCRPSLNLSSSSGEDATSLPSPSNDAVSGYVKLSSTPNSGNVKEVRYMVNGRTVQSSSEPILFDTARVPNGQHTVFVTTEFVDGKIVREMVSLKVKNPENALSPIIRWLKINSQSVLMALLIIAAIISLVVITRAIALIRQRSRERSFHGL